MTFTDASFPNYIPIEGIPIESPKTVRSKSACWEVFGTQRAPREYNRDLKVRNPWKTTVTS